MRCTVCVLDRYVSVTCIQNCFDQSWSHLNFCLVTERTVKKDKGTNWDSMCPENVVV